MSKIFDENSFYGKELSIFKTSRGHQQFSRVQIELSILKIIVRYIKVAVVNRLSR